MESPPKDDKNIEEPSFSKESAPAPRTVYAVMKRASDSSIHDGARRITAIYAEKEDALAQVEMRRRPQTPVQLDMWSKKKNTMAQVEEKDIAASEKFAEDSEELIKPLFVYESVEQLPEEIQKEIRPKKEDGVGDPFEESLKKIKSAEDSIKNIENSDMVYAIIQNHDITEGRGPESVWLLVKNLQMAVAVARRNGVSGSACKIVPLALNNYPVRGDFMNLDTRSPRTVE
jgi:hypothetical protein